MSSQAVNTDAPDLNLLMVHADDHEPVLADGLPDLAAPGEPESTDPAEAGHFWDEGGDPNDLEAQRWGVIAPQGAVGDRLLALLDPLAKVTPDDSETSFQLVEVHLAFLDLARREKNPESRREHLEAAKTLLDAMAARGQISGIKDHEAAKERVDKELAALAAYERRFLGEGTGSSSALLRDERVPARGAGAGPGARRRTDRPSGSLRQRSQLKIDEVARRRDKGGPR